MTGYKTGIGGADTVFPFKSSNLALIAKKTYTNGTLELSHTFESRCPLCFCVAISFANVVHTYDIVVCTAESNSAEISRIEKVQWDYSTAWTMTCEVYKISDLMAGDTLNFSNLIGHMKCLLLFTV